MEAEIIDIESIRLKRAEKRRVEAAVFGRLPCPCCDAMTFATDVVEGYARYSCDGGGTHGSTDWLSDGQGTVADNHGRVRKFFSY